MNLINSFFNLRRFFWLFLILINCGNTASQGFFNFKTEPLVSSLPLPHEIRSRSIRDILFDDSGLLYVSTYNRLYIFNGNTWKYVTTNGISLIEKASDNTIFIADDENFGVLAVDSSFNYRIKPFAGKFSLKISAPSSVKSLISDGNILYIDLPDKVIFFKDGAFHELNGSGRSSGIYSAGKTIILRKNGIYSILQNGRINSTPQEKKINTFSLFAYHPEGFVALDAQSGTPYLLNRNFQIIKRWAPELEVQIKEIHFHQDYYFILSKSNQLVITNLRGTPVVEAPGSYSGSLFNRFIPAPGGDVWLVQDKQIRIIKFPSPLTRVSFQKEADFISDAVLKDGDIIAATSKGLLRISDKTDILTDDAVFALFPSGQELFLAGHNKLMKFDGKRVEKLNDYYGYGGEFDSISGIFAYQDNRGIRLIFPEDEQQNRSVILPVNEISAYTVHQGVLYYIIQDNLVVHDIFSGKEQKFNLPAALPGTAVKKLLPSGKRLMVVGTRECYRFEDAKFSPALISEMLDHEEILEAFPGREGEIIISLRSSFNKTVLLFWDPSGRHHQKIFLPGDLHPYNYKITSAGNNIYLIAGPDEIYLIDRQMVDSHGQFNAIITGIVAGEDTLFDGKTLSHIRPMLRKKLNNIPYTNNNLLFEVHSSDYLNETGKIQYSLTSEGKSRTYIVSGDVLRLENLAEGKYNLKMKIINSAGVVSEEESIAFEILPPLYRRWWAYIIYLLILVTGLFFLYKTYILKLHKISEGPADEAATTGKAEKNASPAHQYGFISNTGNTANKEKKTRWDKYDMATVLFSDIQGFSKIAEEMNPERLIDELDRFFFHFDSVVEKYNIEKIKTIGDAYMAAGGIPRKNSTNPVEVVLAALEMQQFMKQLKKTKVDIWDLRIGIHSGPVIAGIVGSKKRSYDIWGDTVNTASRMESSGEAGKVNISGTTYNLIREYFICEYRGKIPVKYKGNVDMYFVKGLRPELSVNLGEIPNRKFYFKLQLHRIVDIEEFVFSKLEEELPQNMYFHNLEYARHLYEYSALLAKAENLDIEEDLMIRTATLLLPLGYLEDYRNPEPRIAQIAGSILKEFRYSDQQINTIIRLILASRSHGEPENLLERVMVDIKLGYLGRVDFIKLYKLLFLERNEYFDPIGSREWKKEQINLLENHRFLTSGAKKLREISPGEQVQRINDDEWV